MTSSKFRLIFVLTVLAVGFLLGQVYQTKRQEPEWQKYQQAYRQNISNLKNKIADLEKQNRQQDTELEAVAEGRAILVDHQTVDYSPEDIVLTSPSF